MATKKIEEKKEELTFEESLEKLDACSSELTKDGGTLEESMKAYEEGIKYYRICREILDSAEQRIIEIGSEEDNFDE